MEIHLATSPSVRPGSKTQVFSELGRSSRGEDRNPRRLTVAMESQRRGGSDTGALQPEASTPHLAVDTITGKLLNNSDSEA